MRKVESFSAVCWLFLTFLTCCIFPFADDRVLYMGNTRNYGSLGRVLSVDKAKKTVRVELTAPPKGSAKHCLLVVHVHCVCRRKTNVEHCQVCVAANVFNGTSWFSSSGNAV